MSRPRPLPEYSKTKAERDALQARVTALEACLRDCEALLRLSVYEHEPERGSDDPLTASFRETADQARALLAGKEPT